MRTYDAEKNTTEVRQGSRRLMNLRVLLFSVAAVVVAFALIWLAFQLMPEGNVIQ